MTWSEKVMWHISRSVSSTWAHLRCFHRYSLSLSKVTVEKLPMTFHNLKWPWGHEEGSLVAIFQFRLSILPVNRCLRMFMMIFVQNRRFTIFSHWLILERSQNSPDLTWSPISKLWDKHFVDTVTCINRWKFQGNGSVGVALTGFQTFHEVTWHDLVTWPCVTWFWIFHNICEKDVTWGVPKTAAPQRRRFLAIWKEKRIVGGSQEPALIRARVNKRFNYTPAFTGHENTKFLSA